MFDSEYADSNYADSEDNDMELSSIESANFDAMVAEEAILDWLVNLETDDTSFELSESDDFIVEPARLAH